MFVTVPSGLKISKNSLYSIICRALRIALAFLFFSRGEYEGCPYNLRTNLITLQPLVTDHANVPHMEAMDVPFHMGYGGPICSKRLQSDRPKCKGLLVDPGAF